MVNLDFKLQVSSSIHNPLQCLKHRACSCPDTSNSKCQDAVQTNVFLALPSKSSYIAVLFIEGTSLMTIYALLPPILKHSLWTIKNNTKNTRSYLLLSNDEATFILENPQRIKPSHLFGDLKMLPKTLVAWLELEFLLLLLLLLFFFFTRNAFVSSQTQKGCLKCSTGYISKSHNLDVEMTFKWLPIDLKP